LKISRAPKSAFLIPHSSIPPPASPSSCIDTTLEEGILFRKAFKKEDKEGMFIAGIYLVLTLVMTFPLTAGEDKPQTDKGVGEKSAVSTPSSTETDTASKGEAVDKGKKAGEEGGTPTVGGGGRDFLRLAEPKPRVEKKPSQKNVPWGGYWGAVYRRSPEEEEALEEPGLKPPQPQKAKPVEKPRSLAEYREVDFAKFASGSYASDFGGKYVRFHCRFVGLAPEGMRLHDFPSPEYLNFMVVGTGTSMESLTVAARTGLGDKIFRMESGREITLYGLAHRLGLSGLTLIVEEVETRK
jgi:hypothetical protein